MKKTIALIFLLFFVVFPKSTVLAQEVTAMPTLSPTPTPVSQYVLPYPGLLPDNPLYFLKAIRDRMIVFFIADPLKKSAFFLLQSDKRLESSLALVQRDSKHTDLALSTLSKSNNYVGESIDQVKQAKEAGEEIGDMVGKLQQAVQKHREVVGQIIALPNLSQKAAFITEEKRLADLQKVVSQISTN